MALLRIAGITELFSNRPVDRRCLRGARVLAACAIADPESFAQQLRELGARVQPAAWPDHHAFRLGDVEGLTGALDRDVDYVVVTHKDAVKLRRLWPSAAPAPLVAHLEVAWEDGLQIVKSQISRLLTIPYRSGGRSHPGEAGGGRP